MKLFSNAKKKKIVTNEYAIAFCNEIIYSLERISRLEQSMKFIDPIEFDECLTSIEPIYNKVVTYEYKSIKKAKMYKRVLIKKNELLMKVKTLERDVDEHNEEVTNKIINENRNVLGKVENIELDEQQLKSVVIQSHNHLVLAGAGTGKTTIIGKIKYLLAYEKVNVKDILIPSYTNASASEMKERISKETNQNIDVYTFHKLGLEILKDKYGLWPKISKIDLFNFVKQHVLEMVNDDNYFKDLVKYLVYYNISEKSEFDFKNEKEYLEYISMYELITLNGERVKSEGELIIANYLYMNNIKYVYEKSMLWIQELVDIHSIILIFIWLIMIFILNIME